MKKRVVAAITGGVWIAAIGSAVVLTYALNHPHHLRSATSSWTPNAREAIEPRQAVDEPEVVSQVLEIPTVVIVGELAPPALRGAVQERGVTEMQSPDDLIIGPGVVRHQPASPRP
jgi:hypothetical protein